MCFIGFGKLFKLITKSSYCHSISPLEVEPTWYSSFIDEPLAASYSPTSASKLKLLKTIPLDGNKLLFELIMSFLKFNQSPPKKPSSSFSGMEILFQSWNFLLISPSLQLNSTSCAWWSAGNSPPLKLQSVPQISKHTLSIYASLVFTHFAIFG